MKNHLFLSFQLPVVIYKNPGLGFSITGGKDAPGNPFSPRDLVSNNFIQNRPSILFSVKFTTDRA